MSCCWQENSKMIKQTVTHAHNSGTLTYILAHHSHTLQLQYLTDIQHSFLPLKHSLDNTRVWIMERTSSIAIEPHSGCSKWVKFNTECCVNVKGQCIGGWCGLGTQMGGGGDFFPSTSVFSIAVTWCDRRMFLFFISDIRACGKLKVAQWYSFHKKQYYMTLLIVCNI